MRVCVLSPAVEEIAEAALWFDSQSQGLGAEFWQAINEALRKIEKNPTRFAKSEFALLKSTCVMRINRDSNTLFILWLSRMKFWWSPWLIRQGSLDTGFGGFKLK